ncbi:MAG: cadherin-like beta sandwich domain-containing protein [bacterium]|nr:cadherin-like beta sandwich domain-containing protein [bacterium]
MKKIKSLSFVTVLGLLWSMLVWLTPVYAAGTATVGFSGDSTVTVGSNITVTMYVSNVSGTNGGIASVGGNLSFDSDYLEYVSGTGATTPYTFQINPSANYIIAGLDSTLDSGITGSGQTHVFTFVLKAKKAGSTTITLNNAKLTDTIERVMTTVNDKVITIANPIALTKSSDATLKNLEASGYTLSPSFSASTTSYTVKVPNTTNSIKLVGTANDNKATVSGLGNITLIGNTTSANVKVTAEDGTTKTYKVDIIKEDMNTSFKDNDATLKNLDVSGYTLTPAFKKNVTTYSMKVKNNIQGLNVTAIPTSDKAKVTISGNSNWKVGVNKVTIKVTAEDGTKNTYIVNVTRSDKTSTSVDTTTKKSNDNYLKSLTIYSSHEMLPKFNKEVSNYNVSVPYEVKKLDLNYEVNHSKAKAKVKGNDDFKVGEVSVVEIEVEAEDASTRIYSLNVIRSTQESNTDLKDLIVEKTTLSPKFDPDVLEYTTEVGSGVDRLDIRAIPKSDKAKVEIIGNEDLKEGHNNILIRVTDENGFEKYYIIDVVKDAPTKILGFTVGQFFTILGSLLFLLLFFLFLLFWLRKRKEEDSELEKTKSMSPIIEIKPEFNFSSKNISDDDLVHGDLNQNSDLLEKEDKNSRTKTRESSRRSSPPYDPYDDTVTKQEIIDAIHEATKTKDPSKLKMLLDQDELNQRKKEIRRKEEERKRRRQEESNDWRD